MIIRQEPGKPYIMFQSNEHVFIRNEIDDTVFQITKPKDLDSILSIMRQGDKGMKALKCKRVRQLAVRVNEAMVDVSNNQQDVPRIEVAAKGIR